jgi:hypothetical protein
VRATELSEATYAETKINDFILTILIAQISGETYEKKEGEYRRIAAPYAA